MAINTAEHFMRSIIQQENTVTKESQNSLSDPDLKLSCELGPAMPVGSGKSSTMPADKLESVMGSSATNRRFGRPISFDRLAILLTKSGLVSGSIPSSMRKKSDQMSLVGVTEWQKQNHGGSLPDIQKADSRSWLGMEAREKEI